MNGGNPASSAKQSIKRQLHTTHVGAVAINSCFALLGLIKKRFFCLWNNRAWLYQAAASQPRVFSKLLVGNYLGRDGGVGERGEGAEDVFKWALY